MFAFLHFLGQDLDCLLGPLDQLHLSFHISLHEVIYEVSSVVVCTQLITKDPKNLIVKNDLVQLFFFPLSLFVRVFEVREDRLGFDILCRRLLAPALPVEKLFEVLLADHAVIQVIGPIHLPPN